jgi:hypothetical protein
MQKVPKMVPKRTAELLKLSRLHISDSTLSLKGRPLQIWKVTNFISGRCYKETAVRILYDCGASAKLRFIHEGRYFLKPGDSHETT